MSSPRPDGRRPVSSSYAMAASENTSAGVPHGSPAMRSGGLYGRRTGARRPQALQRVDDAETARPRLVRRDEDVAWMQRTVPDAGGPGKVERRGQLRDEWQRLVDRGRRVVPHGHVQRLGGHVLFRAVRDRPFDAGGDRLDD